MKITKEDDFMSVSAKKFEAYMATQLENLEENYVDISACDIEDVFEHLNMTELCNLMRKYMRHGDKVVSTPNKENGPNLTIRYYKSKDLHPSIKNVQTYIENKYNVVLKTSWIEYIKKNHGKPGEIDREHPCPPNHVNKVVEGLKYFDLI